MFLHTSNACFSRLHLIYISCFGGRLIGSFVQQPMMSHSKANYSECILFSAAIPSIGKEILANYLCGREMNACTVCVRGLAHSLLLTAECCCYVCSSHWRMPVQRLLLGQHTVCSTYQFYLWPPSSVSQPVQVYMYNELLVCTTWMHAAGGYAWHSGLLSKTSSAARP